MTEKEKKICPFMTRVSPFGDVERHEYIVECKEKQCAAWQPEQIEMRYTSYDIRAHKVPVMVPGYCKLIDGANR